MNEYEEKAVEAYRQHIREYLKTIENALIENGYKRQRKQYQYERVQWLIWWNINGWSKEDILEELSITNEYLSLDTIYKAFYQFKHFDLPICTRNQIRNY